MTDESCGLTGVIAGETRDVLGTGPAAPTAAPAAAPGHDLPDEPLLVIEPTSGWLALNLHDLWRYRELLFFLTWRDVAIRYKQTVLGAAWAIIQPLFTMILFTLLFGRLAGLPSDGIPYPLFAYAGLLPWMFFSNAVGNSGNSLVGSQNLITKVYFPRMIIPMAAVGAALVDFAVAFAVLVLLMAWYAVAPTWNLLLLPVLVALTTVLAVGMGMLLSALNVKYRDVRYTVPFLLQLWMFASPVIYPVSFVPAEYRWLLYLNPLAGLIDGYRSALFGRPVDGTALGVSAALSAGLLLLAMAVFRRMEREFADVV